METLNEIAEEIINAILSILALAYVFTGCGYMFFIGLLFEGYVKTGTTLIIINTVFLLGAWIYDKRK